MKSLRLLALSLALSLSAAAFSQQTQDVVYLKNGTIIHGSILEFQPNGNVKVKNNVGDIFVYPADQVERMTKESASGDGIRYTSSAAPSYSNSSSSRSLIRGYRGFVDGGVYVGRVVDDGYGTTYTRIGFTTTHGFQFNPHIFLGGGLGWQVQAGDDLIEDFDVLFPVYAAFRYDIIDGKISPFASARIGGYASLTNDYDNTLAGGYFNVNFGVRISRLNMSVGYEAMPGTFSEDDYYGNGKDYDFGLNSFVFRVGVDVGRRAR